MSELSFFITRRLAVLAGHSLEPPHVATGKKYKAKRTIAWSVSLDGEARWG